ncbi:MAG: hypothetical protein NZ870_01915 [bacterium]|nr:hypothetical protein [bacterium]
MSSEVNLEKLKALAAELVKKYNTIKAEYEKLNLTLKMQEDEILKARKIKADYERRQKIKSKLIEKFTELEMLLRSGTDI